MEALLDWWENTKEDMHGNKYHNQRKHFSPFVLSINSMLGREDLVVLAQVIQKY